MQLFNELTDENFVLYASRYYNNNQCVDIDEFYGDLKRFKYLKRLFGRFEHDDLQERLILNHLIVIMNVFGPIPGRKMLFHRIESKYYPALKTFLIYLGYMPEDEMVEIPLDITIIKALRKL